ncbi:helicase 2 [Cotesia congregata filamentous virus 1]|uniref:Helicase 2 n=1 Tax=Cotesia congregata filamentous virus 1 TaxID=3064291 RepID=A0ABC8QKC3_9VIRU|nr:helicase 2 [Cotesia congregata filamentous virus 1]
MVYTDEEEAGESMYIENVVGTTNPNRAVFPYKRACLFRFKIEPYSYNNVKNWVDEFWLNINPRRHIIQNVKPSNCSKKKTKPPTPITRVYREEGEGGHGPTIGENTFDYNEKQKSFLNSIGEHIKSKQRFVTLMLIGPAGTGKTTLLRGFCEPPLSSEMSFLYITTQNLLCRDTQRRLGCETFTICMFILHILRINFYQWLALVKEILSVSCVCSKSLERILDSYMPNAICLPNKHETKPYVLCLDEFSMVPTNLISFIKLLLYRLSEKRQIILILCGDPYQIQPMWITNCTIDHRQEETFLQNLKYLNCPPPPTNSQNFNCLLSQPIEGIHQLTAQMRNKCEEYQKFLKEIYNQTHDTMKSHFENTWPPSKLYNRTIYYLYPVEALLKYPTVINFNNGDLLETEKKLIIEWAKSTRGLFNTIKFFSYTNLDAHYINLYIYRTCLMQINYKCAQDNFYERFTPILEPLMFCIDDYKDLHFGDFLDTRVPVLPLIYGLNYKYIGPTIKGCSIVRGANLMFIAYVPPVEDEPAFLYMVDEYGELYKICRNRFRMNLYNEDGHWKYTDSLTGTVQEGSTAKLLFGFPLQLAIGDTIRSSIGTTVDAKSQIYSNVNGASLEEIYVLFSRCQNKASFCGTVMT